MKKCITCGINKEEEMFYKQSRSNSLQGECKDCVIERTRQRRLNGGTIKKHKHVCSECGVVSWLSKNTITRKRHKELCGTCASLVGQSKPRFPQKKNWKEVYNDPTQTGDTLTEAKEKQLMYYKRNCPKHGPMVYATLDQSCRKCSAERAKERKSNNKEFNRPRVVLASVRRRAKRKGILMDLTLSYIRSIIPTKCPVFGTELSYDNNCDTSPSIDRFDPVKGYTKDNVNIISNRANRIKNNGTAIEHLQLAVWMMKELGTSDEEVITMLNKLLEKKNESN